MGERGGSAVANYYFRDTIRDFVKRNALIMMIIIGFGR
jgi:hypothetical protein